MDTLAFRLTISDIAGLYGVTLRSLRFYEARGLLQPERSGTVRFYHPKDRLRLELILKGKRLGFSLAEIEALILSRLAPHEHVLSIDEAVVSLETSKIAEKIVVLEQEREELVKGIAELKAALETSPTASAEPAPVARSDGSRLRYSRKSLAR